MDTEMFDKTRSPEWVGCWVRVSWAGTSFLLCPDETVDAPFFPRHDYAIQIGVKCKTYRCWKCDLSMAEDYGRTAEADPADKDIAAMFEAVRQFGAELLRAVENLDARKLELVSPQREE